mmetsp:Transcript_9816/g.17702  ORF Transcript_9816/g.17702 Transcript_9816/m.17702 type:complete len:215 (-) Transcript_9816:65-709(-)
MGICDSFINEINSLEPPRSPLDIPSTSSIINTRPFVLFLADSCFFSANSASDRFNTECRTIVCTADLLRESLALNSVGSNPHSLHKTCASVVFPIPGGPEINSARSFFPLFPPPNTEFQLSNHSLACLISPGFAQISDISFGRYLSTHSASLPFIEAVPTAEPVGVAVRFFAFGFGAKLETEFCCFGAAFSLDISLIVAALLAFEVRIRLYNWL